MDVEKDIPASAIGGKSTREESDAIKILVVDDREDKRRALESMLAGEGLEVVPASSGMEALRHLLRENFALILLDVRMPVMDGFETAALIRSRKLSERTPIIFTTAYGPDEAQPSRGYALGAVDYVFTPINEVILKAKVRVFVDLERSRKALRASNERLEAKVRDRTADLEKANESLHAENRVRRETEEFLRASLQEKEALLKEVHHRVKNNLQIITSLLRLQSGRLSDAEAVAQLKASQNRIGAMALVHEKLYRSKDLGHIGLAGYLRDLAKQVFRSYDAEGRGVGLEFDVQDVAVNTDFAIPCGLLLHELITNSLKHAFPQGWAPPDGERPTIRIRSAGTGEGGYRIEVEDNGVGLASVKSGGPMRSLGMELVGALVKQLGGDLEIGDALGTGATFRIRVFPERTSG